MNHTRATDETARLGREIYERDVLPIVEADHHGDVVAIDTGTGQWAVAADVLKAAGRLREQCPQATDVYSVRVGYRALDSFGGTVPRVE